VFTMSVGNIPPGEQIEVELELSGPLAIADGMATFVSPGRGPALHARIGSGWPERRSRNGLGHRRHSRRSRISPPVLLSGYPNPVRLGIEIELDGAGLNFDTIFSSLEQLC